MKRTQILKNCLKNKKNEKCFNPLLKVVSIVAAPLFVQDLSLIDACQDPTKKNLKIVNPKQQNPECYPLYR